MGLIWIVPLAMGFILVGQVVRGFLDHRRIRQEVEAQGGKVHDISWEPFHSSSFARNRFDVYRVTMEDSEGVTRRPYCKTSLGEGVFFADDRDEPMAMDLSAAGRDRASRRRAQLKGRSSPTDTGP